MSANVTAQRWETKWLELRRAWGEVEAAKVERKNAVDDWTRKLKKLNETLELMLRETEPEDTEKHLKRIQTTFAKIEKYEKSRDNTKKLHDGKVAERESIFESILKSDQLPLLLADVSLISSVHIDGKLVRIDDVLALKGQAEALKVRGFRTVDDSGKQTVILSTAAGKELAADAEALEWWRDDDKPFEPAANESEEDENTPRGRQRKLQAAKEAKAKATEQPKTPPTKRKVGDRVITPDDEVGTIVMINFPKHNEDDPIGVVQIEGGNKVKFRLKELKRAKKTKREDADA